MKPSLLLRTFVLLHIATVDVYRVLCIARRRGTMLVSLRHIASLSTLLLVACSGSGSSPPTALNATQTTVNHPTETYAAPFVPAVAPESLRQTRLVNDATRKPMRFDTR